MTDTRNRPRKPRPPLASLAAGVALACGLILDPGPAAAQCAGSEGATPCYAQNNDILNGERALLREDDLLATLWQRKSGEDVVDWYTLRSSQLTFSTSLEANGIASCPSSTEPGAEMSPTQSVIGRVFALPNDVVVSVRPDTTCTKQSVRVDDPSGNNDRSFILDAGTSPATLAMADFDRDGYQDVFYLDKTGAVVLTAKCNNEPFAPCTDTPGNSPADGLRRGPRLVLDHTWYATPPVTGDFNGDGNVDVAWVTFDGNRKIQVRFMSVCPAAGVTVLGQTCSQPLQIIQASAHISTGQTVTPTARNAPLPSVALAAGNFDGKVDAETGRVADELLVAIGHTTATVTVYTLDQVLAAHAGPALTFTGLQPDDEGMLQHFLASGRLDWASPGAQAVFGTTKHVDGVQHRGLLSVITFDENLAMTAHTTDIDTRDEGSSQNKKTRLFGLAVGRFDPPDPAANLVDFNLQIGALVDYDSDSTRVKVFTIDPATNRFAPIWKGDTVVSSTRYYNNHFAQLAPLQAGDIQGRSLHLGAPTKLVVAQTQPDTVLGLPPMHVDFIAPPGGGTPRILNLTVFPDTYNTGYDFEATSATQSTREHATSYSTAVEGTIKGKRVYGNPKASNITVKLKLAVEGSHEREVTRNHDSYSKRTDSFSAETEFDDLVAASSVQMNVWAYPVIGQSVCPESSDEDCPEEQKVPLTVIFSAPDSIVYTQPASAAAFEWFQPVSEPGNVFSYPGSLRLLETGEAQHNPDAEAVDLLSRDDILWESQSDQTVGIQWTDGQGSGKSSGSTNGFSIDFKGSVTKNTKYVAGSRSVGLGVDANHSRSWSSLTTSSQTFDASTGVLLHRGVGAGGPPEDPNFRYAGQSYIFGLPEPENTIQTDVTVPTDVKTHGRIEVAHTTSMLTTGFVQSGEWWKQVYTAAPDVALNHPQRWLQKKPTAQNGQQVMFNCPIGYTSALGTPASDPGACTAAPAQPDPVNVNDAPFYRMKGFFVLNDEATSGPATTMAVAGDVLTLQARVYNYSLKNMEPGTEVHARFYAQPWDATRGQFASGNGRFGFAPAVFIGETILDPIPAFCGGPQGALDPCAEDEAPLNWKFARVLWDTGDLTPTPGAVTYWKFWVVVWMERAGQLVSEIAQHGLSSLPPPVVDSLAEVPVEVYSNNLGFYNQIFTLLPPTSGTVAAAAPAPIAAPAAEEARLSLEAFEAPGTVLRDRLVTVRVHQRAAGRAFEYVRMLLFEGDPRAGGKLLDMDIVPHVPAGSTFAVPFTYHPRACGTSRLFVQAVPVDGGELAEAALDLAVTLDPWAETRVLMEKVAALNMKPGTKDKLLHRLRDAERSFERGNHRIGLDRLRTFASKVGNHSGKNMAAADAAALVAAVEDVDACLGAAPAATAARAAR